MLQRSAENRHLRPIAGPFYDNSRLSHAQTLSRRSFTSGLICLLSTLTLAAQQRPRRIVSTAPSITEELFALGLGGQVVGVSQYCDFPPEVAKLPRVGSYIKPNLEAIARLAPDLVILQTAPIDLTDRLKAMHIAFVEVPHGTLADVFTGIQIIAKSAGVPDRSAPLLNRIQGSLQSIRAKSHTTPSPQVVVILSRRQGTLTDLTAIGPDNYLNEILEIAGGTNVLAKPGLPRYPHISMETIIRENPDMILDLSSMEDSIAARRTERPAWLALWQQNQSLKAARSGHIYFGDSNALLVPGPRAPEAAEILFQYMHGNAHGKPA
jgi:iron complex transport system substrate-binding protein